MDLLYTGKILTCKLYYDASTPYFDVKNQLI